MDRICVVLAEIARCLADDDSLREVRLVAFSPEDFARLEAARTARRQAS